MKQYEEFNKCSKECLWAKSGTKPHDSFKLHHKDSLSARITVQTAGVSSLEQMRLLGHVNTKQRCEIQSVWSSAVRSSQCEAALWDPVSVKRLNSAKNTSQTGETLCNETVRRLHIAIIYHGFTVVTLTAPWYCSRNVGYSHWILLQE